MWNFSRAHISMTFTISSTYLNVLQMYLKWEWQILWTLSGSLLLSFGDCSSSGTVLLFLCDSWNCTRFFAHIFILSVLKGVFLRKTAIGVAHLGNLCSNCYLHSRNARDTQSRRFQADHSWTNHWQIIPPRAEQKNAHVLASLKSSEGFQAWHQRTIYG